MKPRTILRWFRRPRVAVYTAVYGDYDDPKPVMAQSVATDFYMFTDHPPAAAHGWTVETSVPVDAAAHPRMQAKWFKTHPHRLFPDGRRGRRGYDFTIWIDASLQIASPDFTSDLIAAPGANGLAMFGHPWRDCIYDEAVASLDMPAKYGGLPIMAQVESYRAQGYPDHHGLMAATVIVRDTADRGLPAIDEAWWAENQRWTYQDQLSLPFVLWQAGRWFSVIPGDVYRNTLTTYVHHKRDD